MSKSQEATLSSQQEQQQYEHYILKPREIKDVWETQNPRQLMSEKLKNYIAIESSLHQQETGFSLNEYDGNNNYYEQSELNWMSDYIIHNVIFCIKDLKMNDMQKISRVIQVLWELLDWKNRQNQELHELSQEKLAFIKQSLELLFRNKVLDKDQAKNFLDYTKKTYFRHFNLYSYCIFTKQREQTKEIVLNTPEPLFSQGNLSSQTCREIIEEKQEDRDSQFRTFSSKGKDRDDQNFVEEVQEDQIDPNDPLYGLEQRLRNLDLDDESKRIIKEKLEEASNKLKLSLEERQRNLDSKLGDKGPKKR